MSSGLSLADVLVGNTKKAKLQQGWSPQCEKQPSDSDDDWGVLKTTAIQSGSFLEDENKLLPEQLEPKPALEVRAGDLLLTCAGPRSRCGVATLVRACRPKLMISGKMYRFRTDESIMDARFLELYLLSPDAQRLIDAMKTGISDSGLNLTKDRFLELPIPTVSLAEQRRIVALLEEQTSLLDDARRNLDSAHARVGSLVVGVTDRLIWAPGHETRRVDSMLREPMRNGHSAPAVRDGANGIRALTLTAVTVGRFHEDFTKITTADPKRVQDLWLQPGDLLVQRSNTPELVGISALYDGPTEWAIYPDLMIRLRADREQVSDEYLAVALASERARRDLRAKAKGLAGSMPKIDQGALGSAEIPVPPDDEQLRIVEAAREARSHIDRLSQAIATGQSRETQLRMALLRAAFRGGMNQSIVHASRAEEYVDV